MALLQGAAIKNLAVRHAGRLSYEQTEQDPPHAADKVASEDAPDAEQNQKESEGRPKPGGDPCCGNDVAFLSPQRCAQDAAAIQRKCRHEVEESEHHVDPGKVGEY